MRELLLWHLGWLYKIHAKSFNNIFFQQDRHKFTAKSVGERILKIGQYLAKLEATG